VLSKQDNKILDSFSASCVLSLLIGLISVLSLMIWMCRTCLQTTTLILIIRCNILPCGLPHVLAVVDIDQTVSKTLYCVKGTELLYRDCCTDTQVLECDAVP
jgi:hypothetical protein